MVWTSANGSPAKNLPPLTKTNRLHRMSTYQNPSEERPLQRISFIQFQDSECSVVAWRWQYDEGSCIIESTGAFDTAKAAFEAFLQDYNLDQF